MYRQFKRFIARRTRRFRQRSTPHPNISERLRAGERSWQRLQPVFDRTGRIKSGDVLLMTMSRDENLRIPHFLEYYRNLGVDHFFFVDNLSVEPVADLLASEPDCSLWRTEEPYEKTRYGVDWMNAVLPRFAIGHWTLTVDVDEYFVYPFMESRVLRELLDHLDELEKPSLFSLLIDMYPEGPIEEATLSEGQNPLEVAPLFDGLGYYAVPGGHEDVFVRGGPRLRVFNQGILEDAPAINKTPLVKWDSNYVYFLGTHTLYPRRLNHGHHKGKHSPTGALLHFKYLSIFREKVRFAVEKGNHYEGSREYKKYHSLLESGSRLDLRGQMTERFADTGSLLRRNLMTAGSWA